MIVASILVSKIKIFIHIYEVVLIIIITRVEGKLPQFLNTRNGKSRKVMSKDVCSSEWSPDIGLGYKALNQSFHNQIIKHQMTNKTEKPKSRSEWNPHFP
jgi:hypothetical protein